MQPLRAFINGGAIFGAALVSSAPATAADDARRELLRLEAAWNEAVVKRDVAALGKILADDFLLIWADGSISSKARMLESVRSRQAEIDPFTTDEVVVRRYGSVAVVTGRFSQTARLGERVETNSFRYTDVYRKTPQGWRAVSAQATLLRPRN